MRVLLNAAGISFHRQGEPVFGATDISLERGHALIILGPNGCGKTTLLRLLAGILQPTCGQTTYHGQTAFLGHLPAIKGELTCRENLAFVRRFHGGAGITANHALARTGLAGLGLRPARALSAGQKRRLGLAGLLVAPRPIWLLDEPYASLDKAGGELVDQLLDEHLATGGTVALSTHQHMPTLSAPTESLSMPPSPMAGRL